MARISKSQAEDLCNRFVKTRGKALDKIVERETGNSKEKDNISTWFSLEELEQFISDVKDEAKEKGIKLNGFRIYSGAYSKNNGNSKKKAKSTVFIVPTTPKKESSDTEIMVMSSDESWDIPEIDGLNEGNTGPPPPEGTYPQ